MSKGWITTLVVVLMIGGIIFYNKVLSKPDPKNKGGKSDKGGPAGTTTVNGYIARSRNVSNSIVASGTLMAAEQVELHPEISGRITSLQINEGKFVQQGATLVKFYNVDLLAQLRKATVVADVAAKNEQRSKQLLAKGGVSQQEYDLALSQLESAQADVELIRAQLAKTEIKAPFSGVVGLKNVSLGAYVTPATIIATLQQIDPLKIDFFVPEKYSPVVQIGSVVRFDVDGFDEEFSGKIYAIEPAIDQLTRSLKIRALVTNASSRLHPGSFAKVNLNVQNARALMIPTQAVIPQTRGKKVIVQKNGKAVFTDVETGLRTESQIEILSGLNEGDTIVTTGIMFIKPDASIRIARIEK